MAARERKFFVGGNWKMNGTKSSIDGIVEFLKTGPLSPDSGITKVEIVSDRLPTSVIMLWTCFAIRFVNTRLYYFHTCGLDDHYQSYNIFAEVVVAPPSCYLSYVREALPTTIGVSAQNCYKAEKGAFTGEIR